MRIDHFRGFAGYWAVPADEETAINGEWRTGPGEDLFFTIQQKLGSQLPIIAEDLGEITPDVIKLRDQFNLPGMKILQFAFGTDGSELFLPHNYTQNFVVYSGTHDNDTAVGWYQESSTEKERDFFRKYFRTSGHEVSWTLMEAAFSSVANTAIVPLQDLLSLGTEARMNLPGRADGNWSWRYTTHQLSDEGIKNRLQEITLLYGRHPSVYEKKEVEQD